MIETGAFLNNGFATAADLYTADEVDGMLRLIEQADTSRETFRKSAGLFAIRQFLKEVPGIVGLLFNQILKSILKELLGDRCFIVKSIYFDKPPMSNWYVPSHQDLTISVDQKTAVAGFSCWTVKQDQYAVQPPLSLLQNIVTVRIHLDDTDEYNGALKVVPKSHRQGIHRPHTDSTTNQEPEVTCVVPKGGIMLMRPLLLHRSGRTTDGRQRRVIHLEFSNHELPGGIKWAERIAFN